MSLPALRSLAFIAMWSSLADVSHADDLERGRALYVPCAACHGTNAEGNHSVQAPSIAGLPVWYIERQLHNFRSGRRGATESDVYGAQMARMAEQLWDDAEVASVAAYVASLPPVAIEPTVRGGKADRGETLFASCATCHGADATGNAELGAPPLRGRDDWYLMAEMEDFRTGVRGGHADDTPGRIMQSAAEALAGERAALDIAAYLATLRDRARPARRR